MNQIKYLHKKTGPAGRKIFFILMVLTLSVSGLSGQDFYSIDSINTIELTFTQSNWDYILDSLYAEGEEERLLGTAVINGVQYDSVGVRYKGNSSYQPQNVKNPLNIKLDHIIDDQEIEGYGTLKLANGFSDPSFVREVLSYEIARKYMPAGQANYVKVTINDTYIGLYTSVQDVDKYFARTYDYDDDGARFKGILSGGVQQQETVWDYFGTDSTDYYENYEIESDEGWSQLIQFLNVLNNDQTNVEEVLNVDRHLWMLVFDILLVNLDAPVNVPQNYYLFEDFSDRFNPIVWDLNMCLGGFTMLPTGAGGSLSTTQMQQLTPLFNASNNYYPIIKNILSDDTFQRMYFAHMRTMIAENFFNGWYETRAHEIQDIIDAEYQADPNKFFSYSNFVNNIDYASSGQGQNVVGITQLMDARTTYLTNLSYLTATPPTIADITYSPTTVTAGATVTITADVSDAETVFMGWRQSVGNRFEKVTMYDDGVHGDGASGDGIYGIQLTVASSDISYFIYAENSEAGMFAPERAEFEYYLIDVTASLSGDLTINEFLASNETTNTDQNGEYEDWVELYNATGSAISLEGYYLSDATGNVTKWIFPDTSIAPYGYLLIWADEDEDQNGLHASFKLSAGGESIILSQPDLTVVDSLTYGAQQTDVSYGRYPDGEEAWEAMAVPTPEASNIRSSNTPPQFEWTTYLPTQVTAADEVLVMTKAYDESELMSVYLYYSTGSGYTGTLMYDDGAHEDSLAVDSVYAATIPAQAIGTEVDFFIMAIDDSVSMTYDPPDTSVETYHYQVVATTLKLYINEVMADNDTTIIDPDGSGEYSDWFELYNAGDSSISLSGMYLTDNPEDPTQWQIPTGVSIGIGEYLLFWADNNEELGPTHTNFKLSKDGESVGLYNTDANSNEIIDLITFGEQSTDISYGRFPDGEDFWTTMNTPTPGASNIMDECCLGTTGNVDCSESEEPDISDITRLIDFLYLSHTELCCLEEADADGSGGDPDISDITRLIDFLYLTHTALVDCP